MCIKMLLILRIKKIEWIIVSRALNILYIFSLSATLDFKYSDK